MPDTFWSGKRNLPSQGCARSLSPDLQCGTLSCCLGSISLAVAWKLLLSYVNVPLIFSCLVYWACFRSLVLILVSVCWSPQLDQTWGQMKGGLRGEGGVRSSVKWGGDRSQEPFEYFSVGDTSGADPKSIADALDFVFCLLMGVIAALASSP